MRDPDQVAAIKLLGAAGWSTARIGKALGRPRSTIDHILHERPYAEKPASQVWFSNRRVMARQSAKRHNRPAIDDYIRLDCVVPKDYYDNLPLSNRVWLLVRKGFITSPYATAEERYSVWLDRQPKP